MKKGSNLILYLISFCRLSQTSGEDLNMGGWQGNKHKTTPIARQILYHSLHLHA